MKKIISILLCAVMVLGLASCGKKSDQNYDTIENIYKNTKATQEITMNNQKYSIPVRVPNVSEVYSLKLKRFDYVPHMETMVKFFSNTFDPSFIQEKDPNQVPQDNIYETKSLKLTVADGGFTYRPSYNDQFKYDVFSMGQSERISMIKPYRGEPLSEEALPMTDGNLSMKQAGAEVEAFLNEKLKTVEKNYDYKIRTAFTRKLDENIYCYEFMVERFYKGINFDTTRMYSNDEWKVKGIYGNASRVGMPLCITVFSIKGYNSWFFSTLEFNYNVISEQKLENKFLTFDSALNILLKNVSRAADFTINSAEFCYDISYPGYIGAKQLNPTDNPFKRFVEQVQEYNSIPMWMFIADKETDQSHDIHTVYMINAVTGDLYTYPSETEY